MKKLVLAAALSAALGQPTLAGGLSDPVVTPVTIAEDAAASSAPSAMLVLMLTTLIVFTNAATSGN